MIILLRSARLGVRQSVFSQAPRLSSINKRNMASLLTSNSFDPNKDVPSLEGKVFLVTGGSAGIGLGVSTHILQHNPKKLLILSERQDRIEDTKKHLAKYGDVSRVEWVQCNLKDMADVDKTAKRLAQDEKQIDTICLNAGIGVGVYEETDKGIDTHFQINVLSHYVLAKALLPNIKETAAKTGDGRIVFQSSSLHAHSVDEVKFESEAEINQDIGPTKLYNRSKLADLLLAKKFAKDLQAEGVTNVRVNATHPGLVGTEQQQQGVDAYGKVAAVINAVARPIMKDPVDSGCRPMVYAATDPEIVEKNITGQYIVPDKKVDEPSKKAQDAALGERLWTLCGQMVTRALA